MKKSLTVIVLAILASLLVSGCFDPGAKRENEKKTIDAIDKSTE